MKLKICCIYKITSPTGRIYIGQTIDWSRRQNHYKYFRGNTKSMAVVRSINKHGWDNHEKEVLHECLPEELNDLEIYYIELYQTFNSKYGMNLRTGGNGNFIVSDETRKKLSISHLGQVAWSKGLTTKDDPRLIRSEEFKKNVSERMMGKQIFLGGTQTEETRKKISNTMKGREFTEEHKNNLSESKKGEKNGMFGKKHPPERIEIYRIKSTGENNPNFGKKRTPEQIANIKEGVRLSKLKKQI